MSKPTKTQRVLDALTEKVGKDNPRAVWYNHGWNITWTTNEGELLHANEGPDVDYAITRIRLFVHK